MLDSRYDDFEILTTRRFGAQQSKSARGTSRTWYEKWLKRSLDIFAVVLAAPIVVPIVAVIWALTRLDGGHGFYRQARIGRNGATYACWKIRTMVPDADAALARLIATDAQIAAEWRTTQKLRKDPRITPLGQMLRKTSLDELPQLWNVLIGDMSLIGPRPFTPDQRDLYDALPSDGAYYRLRPGISGLWQVDCRNCGRFDDRVGFDDAYGRKISLKTDLRILLKTIYVVFRATGN